MKSLELLSLCEKRAIKSDLVNVSSLSFRGFLGARIWKSYQATPVIQRLSFVRHWVDELKFDRDVDSSALREGWLAVVQNELEALLPVSMDPLAVERTKWLPKIDAPLIVIDAEGHVAAPGTLKVSSSELQFSRARMAILTVCEAPTLQKVLDIPIAVDRVVWRPECATRKTDFVQVRPSAVRLAIARDLAKPSDRLDKFVLQNRHLASRVESKAHWLGLADAKWDERASAYQVRGAIEAVESFRLKF